MTQISSVAPIIEIGMGVLLLLLSIRWWLDGLGLNKRLTSTTAVVDHIEITQSVFGSRSYRIWVQLQTSDGQLNVVPSDSVSDSNRVREGQTVLVSFNPNDLRSVMVRAPLWWIGPFTVSAMGAMILITGLRTLNWL